MEELRTKLNLKSIHPFYHLSSIYPSLLYPFIYLTILYPFSESTRNKDELVEKILVQPMGMVRGLGIRFTIEAQS